MDCKKFGSTISCLRKKHGYTQAKLAEELTISDKAVSKWESGAGYPDIELLPVIARLFGVTVDYLLSGNNVGITVAGSIIADVVKTIDVFPKMGRFANVKSTKRSVGGLVPNTAIDLVKIDKTLPVSALGRIGDDENGRFLITTMQLNGINVSGIRVSSQEQTGFCDVMSLPQGERTFFTCRGANAMFCPEDVDVQSLGCKILHVGYLLYMDKFDAFDPEYGTVLARFLCAVQKRGIKTSIDMLSGDKDDLTRVAKPAFKYCDYVIINEVECCNTWGLAPRYRDGSLNEDNVKKAMEKTMECGVGEKVIVHAKEGGFCLSKNGKFTKVGSLIIPNEQLKGSVGAGDAFCAGCLYSIYNDMSDEKVLEFAVGAAACSLFSENATDGMRSKKEIEKVLTTYEHR